MSTGGIGGGAASPGGFVPDDGERDQVEEQEVPTQSSGGVWGCLKGAVSVVSSVVSAATGSFSRTPTGPKAEPTIAKAEEGYDPGSVRFTEGDILEMDYMDIHSNLKELAEEITGFRQDSNIQDVKVFVEANRSSLSSGVQADIKAEAQEQFLRFFGEETLFNDRGEITQLHESAIDTLHSDILSKANAALEQITLQLEAQALNESGVPIPASINIEEGIELGSTLSRALLEEALLQYYHSANFQEMSDYKRDPNQEVTKQLHHYEAAFLNTQDQTQAQETFKYLEKYLSEIDSNLSEGNLPKQRSRSGFVEDLYRKFHFDTSQRKLSGPSASPTTTQIKDWEKELKRSHDSMGGARNLFPMERRQAAVYQLLNEFDAINTRVDEMYKSHISLDDGKNILIGTRKPLEMSDGTSLSYDGSSIIISKDGETRTVRNGGDPIAIGDATLTYPAGGPPQITYNKDLTVAAVKDGAEMVLKEAEGFNPKVQLEYSDGQLKLIYIHSDEEDSDSVQTLSRTASGGISIRYEDGEEEVIEEGKGFYLENGAKLTFTADGKPQLTYPIDGAFNPRLPFPDFSGIQDPLGRRQQELRTIETYERDLSYIKEEMGKYIECVRELYTAHTALIEDEMKFSSVLKTPTELYVEEQKIRVEVNRPKDDQVAEIKSAIDKLKSDHGFAFEGDNIDQLGHTIKTLDEERVTRKNLSDPGYFDNAKAFASDIFSTFSAKPENNSGKIEALKLDIEAIEADLRNLKATTGTADSAITDKKKELYQKKLEILWYQKDSTSALIKKIIESTGINNPTRPEFAKEGRAERQKVLDAAYQDLLVKYKELELQEERTIHLFRESSAIDSFSGISDLLSIGSTMITGAVKDFWNKQPTLEEFKLRKRLANVGYDFAEEVTNIKDSVRASITPPLTLDNFKSKVKEMAKETLTELYNNPELASEVIADLNQIKSMFSDTDPIQATIKRIEVQALSRAFFEGVPGGAKREVKPETIRKTQAVCDFVRMMVPVMGGVSGAQQGSVLGRLASNIPIIGAGAELAVNMGYGALKQSAIRHAASSISSEMQEEITKINQAMIEGPKGYLKAQARLDAARIAGNTCKAFIDEGNFFTNVGKRFVEAVKFVVQRNLVAVASLVTSGKNTIDKVVGVVAFAVPASGVTLGVLALAGFVTAGAAIPILIGGLALFGVVSAYARKRGHLDNYLHKEENKKIDKTQKQLLLPDSSSLKGIQTAADKEIDQEKLWRQHDKAIKEFCTELYKKEDLTNPASIKVAVSQAIKDNPKAFAAFKEKYELRMQERFEKLDEGKMREDFFKEVLAKKFFSKLREKKIQEIARMSATVLVETGFNSKTITAKSAKEITTQETEKSKIAANVHQNFKGEAPISKQETDYLVDQILVRTSASAA